MIPFEWRTFVTQHSLSLHYFNRYYTPFSTRRALEIDGGAPATVKELSAICGKMQGVWFDDERRVWLRGSAAGNDAVMHVEDAEVI